MVYILKVFILAVAIFLIADLMPTVHLKSFGTAVVVALVYSLINLFFGWILIIITLPLIILTFGLFKLVLNAFLLWITDKLIAGFEIENFGSTLVAALLITIVDGLLRVMLL